MLGFWEKFLLAVFASGPQPTHVGIVLDGSRRWARKRGLTTMEGYDAGIVVMMNVSKLSRLLTISSMFLMGLNHTGAREMCILRNSVLD